MLFELIWVGGDARKTTSQKAFRIELVLVGAVGFLWGGGDAMGWDICG